MSAPVHSVGGAAFLIAVAGMMSRFLGFLRDRMLASSFGAGDVLDAYYAAFRIPDTLYGLLVLGALSAAFVPVFTELVAEKREQDAWKLTSGILSLIVFSLGVLSLIGIFFAPTLTTWLAPGFSEEKQAITTTLTRMMLLSPLFLGISAVFGGVLVSFKQFAAYSFAPVLYNVGIIFGVLVLVPHFGPTGLGMGVVFGSFLHMAIQIPALARSNFQYHFLSIRILVKDAALVRMVRLMIPRSIGMAVNQVSLVVVTVFASTLTSGSLAVFTLANNIQSVPLGLFGIAFSLAAFPSLSLYMAEKRHADFFKTFSETVRRILFFVVPLSVLMVVFRAQFVRVILGAGQFDWEDTILTFEVLKWFSLSLFAQSLVPLLARAFFALQNTKTPLYIALISEVVHLAFIPILLPSYAVEGLAIAFSVGSILNLVLLSVFLRRALPAWDDRALLVPTTKIFFAALFAGAVAQLSKSVFALTTNELDTFIEVFLQLILGLGIGGTVFVVLCYWLNVDELRMIKRFILCKILRQPETAVLAEDHPERGDW